jgi:anti-anti-sigma regulatory factor
MTQGKWAFEQDGLSISVQRSKDAAVVFWLGVSDARNPSPFIRGVAEKVLPDLKGTKVTVDFRSLEYMNSATVAPLISFVKDLDANGSPVLVLYSDVDWQRVHLNCMKSIARTLNNVRVESRPEQSAQVGAMPASATKVK